MSGTLVSMVMKSKSKRPLPPSFVLLLCYQGGRTFGGVNKSSLYAHRPRESSSMSLLGW